MANKKISELQSRTPALSDLMLVGDPSSGYSYKCTVTALATIIETDIADGYVTIGTTQTISGAKTFSNNLTLTSVVNTPTDPDKFLTLNASNVVTYRTGAEVLSDIGGQGALTLTTSGSSGAATLVGNNLNIPNYGSALSGYVPYTGATTNVNLASRYLQANYLVVDGQTNATAINFKQYSSVSFLGDGYTGMGSVSVDKMFFNFAQGSNIFKTFYFDVSAITGNATRAYIMPNADGTLALTSQIPTVSGTTNYVAKFTSSSAVGNSQIFDNGTNVGIGTNTPARTLDVNGIITTNNNLELTSANPTILWTTSNLRFYNNTNGVVATISSAGQLSLSSIPNATTDTDKFLVSDGGVVKYRTGSEVLSDIGAASSSSISGTTNYIPKFTSSSAIGNSIVQDYGDNVWVGSNTAGYGTLNIQRFTSAPYATLTLTDQATSSNEVGIYLRANGSNPVGISSAGAPIAFYTGGPASNERMRLTSGGLLGLGTSSPSEKLDVYDNSASNVSIKVGNTTGALQLLQGNGAAYLYTATNQPLIFSNNNSEKMRLDASGNLGINTSSPSYKLDVSGDLRTTQTAIIGNGASQTEISINSLGGNNQGPFVRFQKAGAAKGYIGTYSAIISGTSDDLTYYATGAQQWMTNNSATTKMTLDASGNLGLGVSPSAFSSSYKAIQFGTTGSIFGESGDAANYYTTNTFIDAGGFKYITSDFALGYFQENGVHSWRTAASGSAGASISFTQAMTLNASGNLGLGVTPSAWSLGKAIDINGGPGILGLGNSTQITNNAYYNGGWLYKATSFAQNLVLDNDGSFRFYQAPSGTAGSAISFTQAMTLDASGRLGIGTTSPTQALEVNGTIKTGGNGSGYVEGYRIIWETPDTHRNIGLNAYQIENVTSQGLTFGYSSSQFMVLNSSGNVGIGTTSPTSLLDLTASSPKLTLSPSGYGGSYRSYLGTKSGAEGVLQLGNNNENFIVAGNTATGGYLSFYVNATSDFITSTNGTLAMRITSGGNVGIGTTSPTQKLHVAGDIQIGESSGGEKLRFVGATNKYNFQIAKQVNVDNGLEITPSTAAGGTTFSTPALVVTSDSKIGIGTTSPTYKLVVSNGGALGFEIDPTNASGGVLALLSYDRTAGSYKPLQVNAEDIRFQTGTVSTERMRITSGGNVGIGTSSPSGNFHIFSSSNVYQNISTNGTNQSAVLSLYNSTATGDGAAIGYNVAMRFGTITGLNAAGFTERMRITSGGDIGISANSVIGSGFGYAGNTVSSASAYLQLYNGSSGETKLWNTGYYAMIFGNGNSERMRLNSDGELLINTTSDAGDYKLQVNGNGYFVNGGLAMKITGNDLIFTRTGAVYITAEGTSSSMILQTSNTTALTLTSSQNAEFAGSIKTAAPSGGTAAAWKLGERVASSGLTLNDTQYIQLDIAGTLYTLATVNLP